MIADVFASCRKTIGLGHLVRSSALASELVRHGWEVNLYTDWCPSTLGEKIGDQGVRLKSFGKSSIDQLVLERTSQRSSDLVVIDSYEIDQSTISEAVNVVNVVVIDDEGDCAIQGLAMIVNPNAWATENLYEGLGGRGTTILCGSRFALLQEEFRRARWSGGETNNAPRFTVIPGGTDVADCGPKLVEVLTQEFKGASIFGGEASGLLGARDVVAALEAVDLAVIGCGTMVWEALCVGSPFVGLLLADNQVRNARYLEDNSFAPVVDCRRSVDADAVVSVSREVMRQRFSAQNRALRRTRLIDGLGTSRVCQAINELVVHEKW